MITVSSGMDFDTSGVCLLEEPVQGYAVLEAVEQELDKRSAELGVRSERKKEGQEDSPSSERKKIDYFKVVQTYPPPAIEGHSTSSVPPQLYGGRIVRHTSAPVTLGEVSLGSRGNGSSCSTARISANGTSVLSVETGLWYDCVEQFVRDESVSSSP